MTFRRDAIRLYLLGAAALALCTYLAITAFFEFLAPKAQPAPWRRVLLPSHVAYEGLEISAPQGFVVAVGADRAAVWRRYPLRSAAEASSWLSIKRSRSDSFTVAWTHQDQRCRQNPKCRLETDSSSGNPVVCQSRTWVDSTTNVPAAMDVCRLDAAQLVATVACSGDLCAPLRQTATTALASYRPRP